MVNKLLRIFLARGWEAIIRKKIKRKLKLYGPYKSIYTWGEFKQLKHHREIFKPLNSRINDSWYKYFTLIRQEEDPLFLPEDLWHISIEPVLNHKSYAKAFNDKNLYHRLEYKELFPSTYLHIIRSICYDKNFNKIPLTKGIDLIPDNIPIVIKKAIDSGGGKGVYFYESKSELPKTSKLIKLLGNDIVIQERVEQHPWFSSLNPTSINTIRILTYRSVKDERIHVLQALLRIGKPGSKVDNQSSGGIACGIQEDGTLNSWGCDKCSKKFHSINNSSFKDIGKVPNFEELKSVCIKLAKERFHERVLVFDTWRDKENKIRLLEINNVNIGIEDLQKNNGPLLGEFTEEIVDYCASTSKSYCFDFEL